MRLGRKLKISALNNEEVWIFCCSFLVATILSFVALARDDLTHSAVGGVNILSWLKWAHNAYFTVSSRVLIYFTEGLILLVGQLAWFIYVFVCIYVLLKAVIILFSNDNKKEVTVYSIVTLLLFPFNILSSAGWIATCTGYLGPAAFSIMSLVPIKKSFYGEKIMWWELVFYGACLLYGTNAEQMCIIVFLAYVTATIYFIVCKLSISKVLFMLVLSVLSLTFIITCPGNYARPDMEIIYFPTMLMFDFIDKADIGLSTTLKWIFAESTLIIILLCVMLGCFIWKKYGSLLFRLIALVPIVVVLSLGPLYQLFEKIFPYAAALTNDIPRFGTFTVESMGKGYVVIQFALFLFVSACICVEIILLNNTVAGVLADIILVLSGVASRCMMGFVPSVYASNERTYAPMLFCFTLVSIHIYSKNCFMLTKSENGIKIVRCCECMLGGAGVINLSIMAHTIFR